MPDVFEWGQAGVSQNLIGRVPYVLGNSGHVLSEFCKGWNYGFSTERLVGEDKRKRGADCYVLLKRVASPGIVSGQCHTGDWLALWIKFKNWPTPAPVPEKFARQDSGHVGHRKPYSLADNDQEPVLVAHVEGVQFINRILPARMGFARLNRSFDLFRGELNFSSAENAFFAVSVEPVDGKLNTPTVSRVTRDDSEIDQVERRAEVVDGIAEGEGDPGWDGYLGLGNDGEIKGYWADPVDDFERSLVEIGLDLPVKVVDVMVRAT